MYLVYGPYQDANRVIPVTIINSLKNREFECSNGLQLRDFTYIDDVIHAIIKTLKNSKSSGEIINIGSGRPISIKKLLLKFANYSNLENLFLGKLI